MELFKVTLIFILWMKFYRFYAQQTHSSYFRLEKENYAVRNQSHHPSIEFIVRGSETECWLKCQIEYLKCFALEIIKLNFTKWMCRFYGTDFVKLSYEATTATQVYSTTARSCLGWLDRGFKSDGVYKILTLGKEKEVFCDMTEGGWTMIQRRLDGQVNFNRSWRSYRKGFGDVNGDLWIGLDTIREMSVFLNNSLIRIQGKRFNGEKRYIIAEGFFIEDKQNKYKLHSGKVTDDKWNIGGDWTFHDGRSFSSYDNDNDQRTDWNCAKEYSCAWWYKGWYKGCYAMNANLVPSDQEQTTYGGGISWFAWLGDHSKSLKTINMSIKKSN